MRPVRRPAVAAILLAVVACGGGGDSGSVTEPPPPSPIPVASVALSRDTATLLLQGTLTLTATTKSATGAVLTGRTVSWSSSAVLVATVSPSGLVTAFGTGTALITATSEGRSASATITVVDGTIVGPTGGMVTSMGGRATLTIPPGALATPTAITITPVASPPLPDGVLPNTALVLGPPGTTFSQPVTLDITFDRTTTGVDTALAFYRLTSWNGTSWVPVPGSTGAQPGNRVRAQVSSLGTAATRACCASVVSPFDVVNPGTPPGATFSIVGFSQVGLIGSVDVTVSPQNASVFVDQQLSMTMTVGQNLVPVGSRWSGGFGITVTKTGLYGATVTGVVPGGPYQVNAFADFLLDCRPNKCWIGGYTGSPAPTDPNDPRWVLLDEVPYSSGGSTEVVVGLVPVASIEVTPTAPSLQAGSSATLTASLKDGSGAVLSPQYRTITWATTNASVASVSQAGVVTALSPGFATISASADGKTGSAIVTVTGTQTDVDHTVILPNPAEVELGNTMALTVWPYDAANTPLAGKAITFSIIDPADLPGFQLTGAASVSPAGIVSGLGLGTVAVGITVGGLQDGTFVEVVPAYPLVMGSPSAGLLHSCLLRTNGSAWCWGNGEYGARGDGTNVASQQTPVQVLGGHTFAALSAGGHRTCALDTSGQAWCWGENLRGQLGNGSTTDTNIPVQVSGGHVFTRIFAARAGGPGAIGSFSCGLKASGEAWCWGWGSFDGNLPATHPTPTRVEGVPAFVDMALSFDAACGITAGGEAWCFGDQAAAPKTPAAGHAFIAIAAGERHFCGLQANGEAWCWGTNVFGELGNGSTVSSTTPVKVVSSVAFTAITASVFGTCALAQDQTAWCWGIHGGNGDGTPPRGPNGIQSQPTPVPVFGGRQFTEISRGNHTCARAADGTWCWGGILDFGELGNTPRYNAPVKVKFP